MPASGEYPLRKLFFGIFIYDEQKTKNGISDDTPFYMSGGTDGARTRDLLRDRQAF